MRGAAPAVEVRTSRTADFPGMIAVCRAVYPGAPPWNETQLASHLRVFPEGQFVAVAQTTGEIVGMASSLIVRWGDYDMNVTWRDITAAGTFANHDPAGRTLYGAEVMVHPSWQRQGVGQRMYQARRDLVRRLRLLRIRAGARLRGYHRYADRMSAEDYVLAVVRREIADPTLTFQLKQGFRVLAVVAGYLQYDPASLGYAAVIEWINHQVARPKHYAARDRRFLPRRDDSSVSGKAPRKGEGA